MSAASLIRDLEGKGVRLEACDGRLRWEAPPGVLTPALLDELRAHKGELLELLSSGPPPDFNDARALAAAWRGAVRELSDFAGYPHIELRQADSVGPGAAHWGVFVGRAPVPDLRLAVAALRELLAPTPRPEDDE
jgi:hypothetical protein